MGNKKVTELLKHGHRVKIYQDARRRHIVAWYEKGKRKLRSRVSFDEAMREGKAALSRISSGRYGASISEQDQLIYERARDLTSGLGPLDLISAEYAQAVRELKGVPLREAVRYYNIHHGGLIRDLSFREAVEEFLTAKEAQDLSEKHLSKLGHYLHKVAGSFSLKLNSVDHSAIQSWINRLKVSQRSK